MDVTTIVGGLDTVVLVARYVLLGACGLLGLVCAADWLVRTRRLSPFGATARFFRSTVDPAIAPVERTVVRYGGVPSAAPWWALLAIVVFGIVLLTLLDGLRDGILSLFSALEHGPRAIVILVVAWVCGLLELALIVRAIASFIRIPYRLVHWCETLTEWLVRPIRKRLPPFGIFDLSLVAGYIVLMVLQWLIERGIAIS
jgi:uncharacterized protein YggT (Ycf19 family)